MSGKPKVKPSVNSMQKFKEKKITHLYFNDKFLKSIPPLRNAKHLAVLYFQNNEIHEITNLEGAENLVALYLQKNRILKVQNLDNLKNLKKLYLGHNTISVVEGLQNLEKLEELHLEKQFLYEGNSLCFDPRSIYGIANSLQILNISYNKIQSISCLKPLKFLKALNASHNDISDMEEVCDVIKDWYYLRDLTFSHNPICKNRLYKENLIANAYSLEQLDQKEISDHTRSFLKRLHTERVAQRLHKAVNMADQFDDLPKKYSSAIQKAVSVSVLKQQKSLYEDDEIFDERNAVYIPWKTLPQPQSVSRLHLISKNQKKKHLRKKSNINNTHPHLQI